MACPTPPLSTSLPSDSKFIQRGFALVIGWLLLWLPVAHARASSFVQAATNTAAQSAQDARPLEPGKPIERELAGGQSHSYQLTLTAGQYLYIVAEQRGIDVVVELFGPDGKKLIEVDSPNGTEGPEPLRWIAESGGTYRLEIRSLEKDAKAGRYEVKVVDWRAATKADRALLEALSLSDEAESLRGKGKFGEALPLAERALALMEQALGPNHLDVAASLHNLAVLYFNNGDYVKAEPLYRRALTIREQALGTNHPDVAYSLNGLARLYNIKGDYVQAEPLYRRALAIYERTLGANHPDVAVSLDNLASLYQAKGDYAQAEPLYKRSLAILEQTLGANHPDVAASLNNLAMLYLDKGDYAPVEPLLRRALAIREQVLGANHPIVADALNNLASLYRARGDYAGAEPLLKRSLAIYEQALGATHPNVAHSLNNLAVLYLDKGDYAQAEPLSKRALAIREQAFGATHPDVARSLSSLASLYEAKGDYAQAEPLFKRALTIREQAFGANHPDVASTLNNLGMLYEVKGDYAQAEPLLKRALAIREQALGANHPDVANALNNLAVLYHVQGDYAQAEPFYKRALVIREQVLGANHPDVATVLSNLAALHRDLGDAPQAIAFFARAAEVREFNLNQTLATGSERQKLLFLKLFASDTNWVITLNSQFAPQDPQALKLALTTLLRRKGRGLEAATDAITLLRRHAKPEDQVLFDKLSSTRSQLATLTLRGPGKANPEQFRVQLKQLEEETDQLEADLSSRSAEFRVQTQPVTIETIQAVIPKGAALVEFASYRSFDAKTKENGPLRYVAYVLAPQGAPRWVDLGEAAPIDRAIDAWRKALRNPKRTDVRQLARAVDEKVMRPVRALLGETRRVLISPDGPFNLIPFAALVDERNRYLVERYEFSYLTSGRDLLRLQVPRASQSGPLVVANPAFGELASAEPPAGGDQERAKERHQSAGTTLDFSHLIFRSLPETASEARALKTLLPQATVLTGEQATEAAIKQAHAPSILHIATHGFFLQDLEAPVVEAREIGFAGDGLGTMSGLSFGAGNVRIENPLVRSGLALAGANRRQSGDNDGVLTALEATSLDLWGTKLVVLSACDTGVGEVKNGEGVYGLRRALVLAGSETQVMSLWPVSDVGTRDLMIEYYKALQRGAGRSLALRKVQLHMLKSKNQQHPYYWASFIQSGEWANLEGKR